MTRALVKEEIRETREVTTFPYFVKETINGILSAMNFMAFRDYGRWFDTAVSNGQKLVLEVSVP